MSDLSIQVTGDADYGRYIKVLFCGDPGSGKTLISSTFPNPIYASAEGGLMSIAERKLPFIKIIESEQLLRLRNAMEEPPNVRAAFVGRPVDTVVIDTIDEIARILVRERLEQNKKDAMAIADWGWLGDQLRAIVRSFRNLDMHVVFTCHLKSTEDSETGRMFFKPAIQGAVGDEIAGYVDLALLLRAQPVVRPVNGEAVRTTVRYLQTTPDLNFPWVKDRSGKLPAELEINFRDDFSRINDLIFGGLDSSAHVAAPPPVATTVEPEPVVTTPPAVTTAPVANKETGEIVTHSNDEIKAMSVKEKLAAAGPWECEDCGNVFDNDDQRDLSVIRLKRILDAPCFKAAMTSKKK